MGTLLYYARSVDCTILTDLKTIAEQQENSTQNTEAAIIHFLDYTATNTTTIVQYKAIDMILHIDSDTPYLSKPWTHNSTVGHYYLCSLPANPGKYPNLPPP